MNDMSIFIYSVVDDRKIELKIKLLSKIQANVKNNPNLISSSLSLIRTKKENYLCLSLSHVIPDYPSESRTSCNDNRH